MEVREYKFSLCYACRFYESVVISKKKKKTTKMIEQHKEKLLKKRNSKEIKYPCQKIIT